MLLGLNNMLVNRWKITIFVDFRLYKVLENNVVSYSLVVLEAKLI